MPLHYASWTKARGVATVPNLECTASDQDAVVIRKSYCSTPLLLMCLFSHPSKHCHARRWPGQWQKYEDQGHFNIWTGGAAGPTTSWWMDDLLQLLEPKALVIHPAIKVLLLIIYHLHDGEHNSMTLPVTVGVALRWIFTVHLPVSSHLAHLYSAITLISVLPFKCTTPEQELLFPDQDISQRFTQSVT